MEQSALRIISLNLNGIRSAAKKGMFEWLARQDADVVCVQELKAQAADMSADLLAPAGYQGHFHYAQKKGYSGTGVYTRHAAHQVLTGFGSDEFDAEGRLVRTDFDLPSGKYGVLSLYLPSGSSSPERQEAKFRFLEQFLPYMQALREENRATGREFVLCGDWNIAHQQIDLKNWRSNQKNSGFLPEERAWLTQVFEQAGFVDVFRKLDPRPEQYTWWSNRGQAWAKNVGWRIDYQIATPGIAERAHQSSIYIEQRFSDHAPLIIDYRL
jgi:exodeoxyribonuclease-3